MIKKLGWLIFLLWPLGSQAAITGFLDNPALKNCLDSGDCQLADISTALILLIKLLLGGMAGVALLFFIYGGIEWLTSEGVPNRISRGKEIMVNTIWALVIAFTSYLVLSFFVNNMLNVKEEVRIAQEVPECQGKADNTACGGSDVYVCYQEDCISRCEMKAVMANEDWRCHTIAESLAASINAPAYFEKDLCPGGVSNICTKFDASGNPAIFADPTYQAISDCLLTPGCVSLP
ncbi:MAG: hypothetical protein WC465_03640 [Patescibacteria group bacterium]